MSIIFNILEKRLILIIIRYRYVVCTYSQFVISLTLLTTILSSFTYFKLLLIIYCQMYVLRIDYSL